MPGCGYVHICIYMYIHKYIHTYICMYVHFHTTLILLSTCNRDCPKKLGIFTIQISIRIILIPHWKMLYEFGLVRGNFCHVTRSVLQNYLDGYNLTVQIVCWWHCIITDKCSPNSVIMRHLLFGLNCILENIFKKMVTFSAEDKDWVYVRIISNSPDSTPGALRLLWHKACAAEAWGTAGSGNGRHITDIAIWWFGRDVITASVLICMYAILNIENKKGWAPSSDHRNSRHKCCS